MVRKLEEDDDDEDARVEDDAARRVVLQDWTDCFCLSKGAAAGAASRLGVRIMRDNAYCDKEDDAMVIVKNRLLLCRDASDGSNLSSRRAVET